MRKIFYLNVTTRIVTFRKKEDIEKNIPPDFAKAFPNCLFRIDGYERQIMRAKNDSLSNRVNYNAYYGELGIHCLLVQTPDRLISGLTAFYPGASSEFKHLLELSHLPLVFLAYHRDKMPKEMKNLKIENMTVESIHQLRNKLNNEGKLIGICLGDGAFSFSSIGNWQYIITPQQLPRNGSASSDPISAKTVAKHRAGIEHLVGKFKQAKACNDAFPPSEIEKAQYNVFIRAAIINLNQFVLNGMDESQIVEDLSTMEGKFFLNPFEDADLSELEFETFLATPQNKLSNDCKKFIKRLNNCALSITYLHDVVKMTFGNYKRANLLVESGHINKIDYALNKNGTLIIRAIIFSGYFTREHMVVLEMTSIQPVKNYYCSCVHSNLTNVMCRHVECLLLKLFQYQIANSTTSIPRYQKTGATINKVFQKLYNCTTAFKIINVKCKQYLIQKDYPIFLLREHTANARNKCSVKLKKYGALLGSD